MQSHTSHIHTTTVEPSHTHLIDTHITSDTHTSAHTCDSLSSSSHDRLDTDDLQLQSPSDTITTTAAATNTTTTSPSAFSSLTPTPAQVKRPSITPLQIDDSTHTPLTLYTQEEKEADEDMLSASQRIGMNNNNNSNTGNTALLPQHSLSPSQLTRAMLSRRHTPPPPTAAASSTSSGQLTLPPLTASRTPSPPAAKVSVNRREVSPPLLPPSPPVNEKGAALLKPLPVRSGSNERRGSGSGSVGMDTSSNGSDVPARPLVGYVSLSPPGSLTSSPVTSRSPSPLNRLPPADGSAAGSVAGAGASVSVGAKNTASRAQAMPPSSAAFLNRRSSLEVVAAAANAIEAHRRSSSVAVTAAQLQQSVPMDTSADVKHVRSKSEAPFPLSTTNSEVTPRLIQLSAAGKKGVIESSIFGMLGLAAPAREMLMSKLAAVKFSRGEYVFKQSDVADCFVLIAEGEAKVEVKQQSNTSSSITPFPVSVGNASPARSGSPVLEKASAARATTPPPIAASAVLAARSAHKRKPSESGEIKVQPLESIVESASNGSFAPVNDSDMSDAESSENSEVSAVGEEGESESDSGRRRSASVSASTTSPVTPRQTTNPVKAVSALLALANGTAPTATATAAAAAAADRGDPMQYEMDDGSQPASHAYTHSRTASVEVSSAAKVSVSTAIEAGMSTVLATKSKGESAGCESLSRSLSTAAATTPNNGSPVKEKKEEREKEKQQPVPQRSPSPVLALAAERPYSLIAASESCTVLVCSYADFIVHVLPLAAYGSGRALFPASSPSGTSSNNNNNSEPGNAYGLTAAQLVRLLNGETVSSLLFALPFFRALSRAHCYLLASLLCPTRVGVGGTLFSSGDPFCPCSSMCILFSGAVDVQDDDLGETVHLCASKGAADTRPSYKPRQYFGQEALFAGCVVSDSESPTSTATSETTLSTPTSSSGSLSSNSSTCSSGSKNSVGSPGLSSPSSCSLTNEPSTPSLNGPTAFQTVMRNSIRRFIPTTDVRTSTATVVSPLPPVHHSPPTVAAKTSDALVLQLPRSTWLSLLNFLLATGGAGCCPITPTTPAGAGVRRRSSVPTLGTMLALTPPSKENMVVSRIEPADDDEDGVGNTDVRKLPQAISVYSDPELLTHSLFQKIFYVWLQQQSPAAGQNVHELLEFCKYTYTYDSDCCRLYVTVTHVCIVLCAVTL